MKITEQTQDDYILSLIPEKIRESETFGQDEIDLLKELDQESHELNKVIALMDVLEDWDVENAIRLIEDGDYDVYTYDEANERAYDYI
jgi:hypothetical protein